MSMAVCRQCSYDSSYLFVEAPANPQMMCTQQGRVASRMVWVPFNADFASTVGETISSVVQEVSVTVWCSQSRPALLAGGAGLPR